MKAKSTQPKSEFNPPLTRAEKQMLWEASITLGMGNAVMHLHSFRERFGVTGETTERRLEALLEGVEEIASGELEHFQFQTVACQLLLNDDILKG